MGRVQRLTPREVVRQDMGAIAQIYRNLGAPVAEQLVMRALGEVALTMANIADRVKRQDMRDLARNLGRLRRLADDIGLSSLSTVAGDAAACFEQGDSTAFAAVWARLMRVASSSLSPDLDGADFPT